jgi:hypothetical protein
VIFSPRERQSFTRRFSSSRLRIFSSLNSLVFLLGQGSFSTNIPVLR